MIIEKAIQMAVASGSAEFNGKIFVGDFSDGSMVIAWVSCHGGNYYTLFDATTGEVKTNSKIFTRKVKAALAA